MTELKPCPFCGHMPQVSSYEYHLPLGKIYGTQWKVECMVEQEGRAMTDTAIAFLAGVFVGANLAVIALAIVAVGSGGHEM